MTYYLQVLLAEICFWALEQYCRPPGDGHWPGQALHAADGLTLHPRRASPAAEARQRALTRVARAEPWVRHKDRDAQVRCTLRGCGLAHRIAPQYSWAAMQFLSAAIALP